MYLPLSLRLKRYLKTHPHRRKCCFGTQQQATSQNYSHRIIMNKIPLFILIIKVMSSSWSVETLNSVYNLRQEAGSKPGLVQTLATIVLDAFYIRAGKFQNLLASI